MIVVQTAAPESKKTPPRMEKKTERSDAIVCLTTPLNQKY
jgi:hypothetical protein